MEEVAMIESLARNWWAVGIRGIGAIIFGVLAFIWPDITLIALALLIGAYAIIFGIALLALAWRLRVVWEGRKTEAASAA
jgi:uncharacterized membrane protein HdeD (DUF308 family)